MAWNSSDMEALQYANGLGITLGKTTVSYVDTTIILYTLDCPDHLNNPRLSTSKLSAPAHCLARAVEAVTRFDGDNRLWLRIQGDVLPAFVYEAVTDYLVSFGTRMAVTQGNACSHAPGPRLDPAFSQEVLRANNGVPVWHPFAKQWVN